MKLDWLIFDRNADSWGQNAWNVDGAYVATTNNHAGCGDGEDYSENISS